MVTSGGREVTSSGFERVVCLIEESPAGIEALRQGMVLRAPGGEILGVVPCDLGLMAEAGFAAVHAARQLEEDAVRVRDAAAAELAEVPSSAVEILSGRSAPVLLGAAERARADLVAVGRHGSSRRRGIILGSIVTEMIHRAPCCVLVARSPAAGGQWRPRTLTAGVDGSACSLEALAVARALGRHLDADVRLLAATGGKPLDRDDLRGLGDVELDDRAPVDALVAASERSELVVVGCRGLHGLASLGSVSERVAHRAACSVLVVRHRAA